MKRWRRFEILQAALRKPLAMLVLASVAGPAFAGEINTGYFGDIAIKGYDPVAYFTMGKATKGSADLSLDWLGATWLFANDEHRRLFEANSVAYAPQYGGHCADGVAYGGITTNIDPEAWRIIDGKLYLNFDKNSAVEIEKSAGLIQKADGNWPDVRTKLMDQN